MAESKKNIVLVDDHIIVRSGLKELISKLGPYHISHQFDSGNDVLNALPLSPAPDLIVLDYSMPGLSGQETLQKLLERNPDTPVLFLTLNDDENTIIQIFRLGARGYLKKNCSSDSLKEALSSIFSNGYYHNEFLTLSIRHNERPSKKTEQEKLLEQITEREREFLKLVCHEKEYTYDQIADQMKVQSRTVDGYRENLFDKFGIKSKTGLVLFVLKYKLFDLL